MFHLFLFTEKIELSYSRSSGPGGQNVNKTNTKVDVRFILEKAEWIPEDVKTNMKIKVGIKYKINHLLCNSKFNE